MITNSSDLRELLSAKGVKPTYQRLKILQVINERSDHPTADMIYQALVREIPTISKTTVYNTLKTFIDKEIVLPVIITGTETRFDRITSCHHHFLCEQCGRIIDLDVGCPNLARREIQGHRIKELHGYFKGICSTCARHK
jgi:Fur family peroxide stress response transcriptional regulator